LKTITPPSAIVLDAEKVDVELLRRNLEVNPSGVLSLYNYLLEKGIVKVA
jgi:hypothetical protein